MSNQRSLIIAANWKMNMEWDNGVRLAKDIAVNINGDDNDRLAIICPPFHLIHQISDILGKQGPIKLGAQNCHHLDSGAFTGEISAKMLASIGVEFVIIGHSERRALFHEDNHWIAQKVSNVLNHQMNAIFCCGESLEERESGDMFEVVELQLKEGLFHLDDHQMGQVIIAYEPVWAIGTGQVATPEQAQEMHRRIREIISNNYSSDTANSIHILYGGSIKPENAREIFDQEDVDGGLIGGASLDSDSYVEIYRSI